MGSRVHKILKSSGRPSGDRATVAAGFVTGLLSGLEARHGDREAILAGLGIDRAVLSDSSVRVPLQAYADLYGAVIRLLDDEGFALFASPLRPGTFEFMCRSAVGAATLGEALERAARFLALVLTELRVTVGRRAGRAQLVIVEACAAGRETGGPRRDQDSGGDEGGVPRGPKSVESRFVIGSRADDPRRVFAFEWLLRLLHALACWLAGRSLVLEAVRFPYPRPAHAADYGLVYTENSTFGGPDLVAALDAALLDLPVRRDPAELAAFLEGAPARITMLYRRDRGLSRALRGLLADALPRAVGLEEAARALHLSARTLHRHLEAEGTSFRAIKDALRRDLARERLSKPDGSVARVAAELGYSEPSAFFRAFQGWTGEAPSAWRKRHIARG